MTSGRFRPERRSSRATPYATRCASRRAAGIAGLLVTEAGGTSANVDGRPWTVASDSFVGSARRRLHDELRDLARRS